MSLNGNTYSPTNINDVSNNTEHMVPKKKPKKAKKAAKETFWIILSSSHDAVKFGANYKFRRFKTEREAKVTARIMTQRHNVRFDVLKQVTGYKPVQGTIAVKI